MAVDVYSENFIGMMNSPRFSFSKDVEENETINPINNGYNPYRLDHSVVVDSPFDFAFNVDSSTSFHSSTADELFSDGKILPTCVKKDAAIIIPKLKQDVIAVQCSDPQTKTIKKSLKEFLEDSSDEEEEEETSNNNAVVVPKPFWMFRRSNSLNCDTNKKKGFIGSWKILSRSGSTGKFLERILEEDEEKPVKNPRFFWKFSRSNSLICDQNITGSNVGDNKGGNTSINLLRRSNSTNEYFTGKSDPKPFRRSNSTGSAPNQKQKQQEMTTKSGQKVKGNNNNNNKNGKGYDFGSYYSNSGKISPLLNLPSPYISRLSVDLFGMGSLFCNTSTKDRKKKK